MNIYISGDFLGLNFPFNKLNSIILLFPKKKKKKWGLHV